MKPVAADCSPSLYLPHLWQLLDCSTARLPDCCRPGLLDTVAPVPNENGLLDGSRLLIRAMLPQGNLVGDRGGLFTPSKGVDS